MVLSCLTETEELLNYQTLHSLCNVELNRFDICNRWIFYISLDNLSCCDLIWMQYSLYIWNCIWLPQSSINDIVNITSKCETIQIYLPLWELNSENKDITVYICLKTKLQYSLVTKNKTKNMLPPLTCRNLMTMNKLWK